MNWGVQMSGDNSETVLSKLRTVLSQASHVALPEITADTDPWTDFDLSISELVSLEVKVEIAFGIMLPHHAMLHFRTVGELAVYLDEALAVATAASFIQPVGARVRAGISPAC